jgi:hypothetical protein
MYESFPSWQTTKLLFIIIFVVCPIRLPLGKKVNLVTTSKGHCIFISFLHYEPPTKNFGWNFKNPENPGDKVLGFSTPWNLCTWIVQDVAIPDHALTYQPSSTKKWLYLHSFTFTEGPSFARCRSTAQVPGSTTYPSALTWQSSVAKVRSKASTKK